MASAPPDLKLKFGGRLVEQLGAHMYPSATATVAELISNAWDADATNVWVDMPFGDWQGGEIVVVDDGHGMSAAEARDAYLVVGRNRRRGPGGQRSPGGRLVHGRKGIGKLAAFGTARVLELKTRRVEAELVAFRLDYDRIREHEPDDPYTVEDSTDVEPLVDPQTGEPLAQGTRIRLTGLRLRRRLDADAFIASMSRRFALEKSQMRVLINGRELERYLVDLEILFPRDGKPVEVSEVDGRWAIERLANGEIVRWWIGFTPKPIAREGEQGLSILARGKLVQRPFKFERYQGVTGQLGQEYLVGEVVADWLDDEELPQDVDYVQANRDQLQLEDDDLEPLVAWGRRRIAWALAERGRLREERILQRVEGFDALRPFLDPLPAVERLAMKHVAAALVRLEVDDEGLTRVMQRVVDARTENVLRQVIENRSGSLLDLPTAWDIVREMAPVDARSIAATVDARILLLERFLEDVETLPLDPQEWVTTMQVAPWLLNPAWDARTVDVAPLSHHDGSRLLLFVPAEPAPADAITAVALVGRLRGPDSEAGELREIISHTRSAAEQLARDVDARDVQVVVLVHEVSAPAHLRGEVVSWREMLEASERLHEGWLAAAQARIAATDA